MNIHEPFAYSGAGMGHALLRKRQDVAVSEARISLIGRVFEHSSDERVADTQESGQNDMLQGL